MALLNRRLSYNIMQVSEKIFLIIGLARRLVTPSLLDHRRYRRHPHVQHSSNEVLELISCCSGAFWHLDAPVLDRNRIGHEVFREHVCRRKSTGAD